MKRRRGSGGTHSPAYECTHAQTHTRRHTHTAHSLTHSFTQSLSHLLTLSPTHPLKKTHPHSLLMDRSGGRALAPFILVTRQSVSHSAVTMQCCFPGCWRDPAESHAPNCCCSWLFAPCMNVHLVWDRQRRVNASESSTPLIPHPFLTLVATHPAPLPPQQVSPAWLLRHSTAKEN